jgi:hypothetical protein
VAERAFIASPIALEWQNALDRRRKRRELVKYGIGEAGTGRAEKAVEVIEKAAEEQLALGTDGLPAQAVPFAPAGETGIEASGALAGEAQPDTPAAAPASAETAPRASTETAPDSRRAWAGSRRHKKHRRGH